MLPVPDGLNTNQQLASFVLGEDSMGWIMHRRELGLSYRQVSQMLLDATEGRIDIHPNTINRWVQEAKKEEVPAL